MDPQIELLKNTGCRLLLVLPVVLASGCSNKIGPDYQTPETQVSPDWLESEDTRVSRKEGNFREWWRIFKDPVLNKLVETAYSQNLPLQVAAVRILGSRAELGIATGNLFPQQQGFEGQTEKISLPFLRDLGLGSGNSLWYTRVGVMSNWEIDIWGKYRRAIESADAQLMASIAEYDDILVTLTADVANTYILIRTLEKRLDIARHNVETQSESLRIAEAKFHGGTSTQRDVEQAKTVLAGTQATIPVLEAQLRQAKNTLCYLLGMPPDKLDQPLGSGAQFGQIPAPPVQVAVGIPADLLRRRPDVRRAEQSAAAQSARIGIAKAALYPAFSISGSFGFVSTNSQGHSLGDIFNWGQHFYRFGPSVQWNLFNYGQLTNQVRAQDARFQELALGYQNTVLKAQQEAESALIGFLKTQNSAQFLAESTAAAQRSLDLATLQYREGIADFTTVLTAEQDLLKQQDNFAQTLGSIATHLVGVYRALGGGWQIREGKDFVPEPILQAMGERTHWGDLLKPGAVSKTPPANLIRAPDW
ncbi:MULTISPECIES: efflux transporter outer membrane subunit [Methylococcus]|uniref:Efflux transporter outer membrane subunit n=1 Tax=Methylococcus capsulatus TaxID=414 RepID=A0ABZ2F401_METCP|nr:MULTISPECIES: efflux transporter outer membrane subunit [Methylococcus]MDF9391762.1 efflux transporter outer membrane subunit [Methylococcus capsulatus]